MENAVVLGNEGRDENGRGLARISRIIPYLCGMGSRLRGQRLVMVMRAFFDESGLNPHEDNALVMGGYLGTVLELEKVSDGWDTCLAAHPKIGYFKSDEAKNLTGEFRRFGRASAE